MTEVTKDHFDKVIANLATKEDIIGINVKLDALMEAVAIRQELRNLVSQLKTNGIELDEAKIFAGHNA